MSRSLSIRRLGISPIQARLALCAGIAVTLAITAAEAGKQPVVEGGQLEFQLTDLAGKPVRSTDPRFAGKVLLVDLWATWCPPCITEIPVLTEIQTEYGDRGLVVVAIAFEAEEVEQERRARIRGFVAEHGTVAACRNGYGFSRKWVRKLKGEIEDLLE